MEKFAKFRLLGYYDEKRAVSVKVWNGVNEDEIAEKCREYAKEMNSLCHELCHEHTFIFVDIMSKEEALEWLTKETVDDFVYGNPNVVSEIPQLWNIYYRAYGD